MTDGRTNVSRLLTVAMVATVLGSCTQSDEIALQRGAELLMPFKQELKGALQAGLQDGPAEAISACRIEAPEIAERLSVDSVTVGRSSHKLRNPANRGPDWVTPVLEAYVSDATDREPRVVSRPDGQVGYVEPIAVQPVCLICHGETLAPDLVARLEELYPEDEATGFREGDLRGVFWAEFPQ